MASAVHIGPSSAASAANAQQIAKLNPVAQEVRVVVTGAHPAAGSGKRELFTEATSTVLVFENGGVIRLDAAVASGQLLFLTNEETRREVVAQVTRKRPMQQTGSYVELEFTEPAPGFWGIEFPEMPDLAPASAEQREAAELVQSAERAAGNPGGTPSAPSAHEVDALKQEVEVLREQLKSVLQTTNGAAQSDSHGSAPADPVGQADYNPAAASGIATESPADHSDPALSDAALLPKPALDFDQAKEPAKGSSKTRVLAGTRPRAGHIGLIAAALLLAATGAAWYRHWLPWLAPPRNASTGASASLVAGSATVPVHPAVPVHSAPQKPRDVSPDSGNTAQSSGAPASPSSTTERPSSRPAPHVASATSPETASSGADSTAQPSFTEKPAPVTSVAKRSSLRTPTNTSFISAAPPSEDGVTVPPKLIQAVRPNPPEEALRNFVSGDVMLDAVVDTSGHVKSMNVLSGPATLRDAARDALKQYRYEPAMQKGKPVAAHVNVKIQFWYEP